MSGVGVNGSVPYITTEVTERYDRMTITPALYLGDVGLKSRSRLPIMTEIVVSFSVAPGIFQDSILN
jgi:hypothetical protein